MQENNIKDAVNGIAFTEETKSRIREGILQKSEAGQTAGAEKYGRKIAFSGKMKAAAAFACVAVMVLLANTRNGSRPYGAQISAYAKGIEGENVQVVMSPEQEIELVPVETPAGYGYSFKVDLQDKYTYVTTVTRTDENGFVMYQDEECFYCIGGPVVWDNIREDQAGDQFLYWTFMGDEDEIEAWINTEYIDGNELEITIYDDESQVSEKRLIRFKTTDGICTAVLLDSQEQK